MIENKKVFPGELKRKLLSKISNKIEISFYDGSYITSDLFKLSIFEPYKIVFAYKNNTINVFVVDKIENNKNIYDFFVGSIQRENKYTMTSLIALVNSSI